MMPRTAVTAAAAMPNVLSGPVRPAAKERAPTQNFDLLMHTHQRRVFRFLLASLRDRDAAETLTQETFLKVFKSLSTFRGEAAVGTWVMQIAVNLMRDHLRNRRWQFWKQISLGPEVTELGGLLPQDAMTPEQMTSAKEQVQAVWRAANQLSERQRTVFLLRFVEEMDLLEIAAATGMKHGTVKVHLFRALHAVRKRLEESR